MYLWKTHMVAARRRISKQVFCNCAHPVFFVFKLLYLENSILSRWCWCLVLRCISRLVLCARNSKLTSLFASRSSAHCVSKKVQVIQDFHWNSQNTPRKSHFPVHHSYGLELQSLWLLHSHFRSRGNSILVPDLFQHLFYFAKRVQIGFS